MSNSRDVAAHEPGAYDEIDDALPVEPANAAQFLLYLIAGLVVLTLIWASVARLGIFMWQSAFTSLHSST